MAKKGGVGECENKLRKSYGNLETSESDQGRRRSDRKNNYTMQINKEEREKERRKVDATLQIQRKSGQNR